MTLTSIEGADAQQAQPSEAELAAAGWQRCFVADEPRLSEAVEAYREMGLEVVTVPVSLAEVERDSGCSECMRQDPERYRVIYTRKPMNALRG
jgi:hypothetical protein